MFAAASYKPIHTQAAGHTHTHTQLCLHQAVLAPCPETSAHISGTKEGKENPDESVKDKTKKEKRRIRRDTKCEPVVGQEK